MKKIFKWLQGSFLDRRGHASSRKLTAFICMLLIVISWFMDLFYDKTVDSIILYSLVGMAGLSLGLFTAQNIVDAVKKNNDYPYYSGIDNTNILINNKKKSNEPEDLQPQAE